MLKICCTIIATCWLSFSLGQQLFNNKYDIDKGVNTSYGLFYNNGAFYLSGAGIDSGFYVGPTLNNSKIELLKINNNGNLVWHRRYGNDSIYYSFQFNFHPVKKNNSLYLSGLYLDIYNKVHQYLFKYNSNGDSLLLKHYFKNDTTIELYSGQCKINRKNQLLLSGVVDSTSYAKASQMYLMQTDTLGNINWMKTYGGSNYENCTNMDTCSDGGYILGGWTSSFGGTDQDPYIVKTDSNGVLQWQKFFNYNAFNDWPAIVKSTNDGGVLAVTSEKQKLVTAFSYATKVYLNKYDINGTFLWRKAIADTLFNAVCFSVKEQANGNLVVLLTSQYYNAIAKTNALGDSLLMQTFYRSEYPCHADDQYAFDLALTDSGGYAIAGFIVPYQPNINETQDAWLATFDSLGCQLPQNPFNLTAQVNYINNDTLVDLNWQYNSTNPNEKFVVERYIPDIYGWDIIINNCYFGTAGHAYLNNTQYTDTLVNSTKVKYRVFAVDTITHLMSCHSNIATVDLLNSTPANLDKTQNTAMVYPNPSNGVVIIELAALQQQLMAIVYTLTGKKILSKPLHQLKNSINLSKQPKGVYLLKIVSDKQVIVKRMVIK